MRVLKKVSVFLLIISISFISGVYYEKVMNSFYPNNNGDKVSPVEISKTMEDEMDIPALQSEGVITADTKLIIIEHNLNTGEEIRSENIIPTKYIGLNREKFITEMEHYEISPALPDIRKGFRNQFVISFSHEEIILQKNYSGVNEKTHFYIVSKDNKLVVYYEDMETIFLTTNILLNSLPINLQLEILGKKYFETEEELYNFLESYSS